MRGLLLSLGCYGLPILLRCCLGLICDRVVALGRFCMIGLRIKINLTLCRRSLCCTRGHWKRKGLSCLRGWLFRSRSRRDDIGGWRNSKVPCCSRVQETNNLILWVFDRVWWRFQVDLCRRSRRRCWLQLKCYNFRCWGLVCSRDVIILCYEVDHRFYRWRYLILVRRDVFFWHLEGCW